MHIVSSQRHRALNILVLLAFLLQAFVPAGFMPSFGDDGKVKISICTAQGFQTIFVDGAQSPEPADEGEQHDSMSLCPYAFTASKSAVYEDIAAYHSAVLSKAQFHDVSDINPQTAILHPWSSRAPPAVLIHS